MSQEAVSQQEWQTAIAAFRAEQETLRTYFKARTEISQTNKAINFYLKKYVAKMNADTEVVDLKGQRSKINDSLGEIKERFLAEAKTDKVKGTDMPVSDAVASLREHIAKLRKEATEAMQGLEKGVSES